MQLVRTVKRITWPVRQRLGAAWRRAKLALRWAARGLPRKSSPLPGPLVISLTSYPPRYPTLHLTLKCLLTQSIRCDHVVLWVAEKDAPLLTPEIRSLEDKGLTIAVCPDDLRSYNKLFHSLTTYPSAFVLTADDDVYYWSTWAEELAAKSQSAEIVECHRCHKITLDDAGLPRPYAEWEQELSAPDIGPLVFPTGNGGVLYPPAPFGPEFFSIDKLRELSPLADDIWIYWMGRRNGRLFCQIGTRRRFWNWEDSQNVSLMSANLGAAGGNDRQLNNLISEYSWPPASQ